MQAARLAGKDVNPVLFYSTLLYSPMLALLLNFVVLHSD